MAISHAHRAAMDCGCGQLAARRELVQASKQQAQLGRVEAHWLARQRRERKARAERGLDNTCLHAITGVAGHGGRAVRGLQPPLL
mmetsp:Transcript_57375/g.116843  ORF Transcript_57375/g.116843 Transcript_57375/m.116843 type:complete len:85 (-) Transcript_57375:58-312(-)